MKGIFWTAFIVITACNNHSYAAASRFEKVSDHCYYLQLKESGDNVAAVVTDEGVLMVDPPDASDLSVVMEALKHLTSQTVRWIVFTDYRFSRAAGARYFAQRGATLIANAALRALISTAPGSETSGAITPKPENRNAGAAEILSYPWFVFGNQMRLFPAGLEIRVIALKDKALTGGDVVVIVPAERVLFTGGLFESGRYPDIDRLSEGSASGWIDGLKQVMDAMPVLKPAVAQAKSEFRPEQGKTLEEGIAVIPARGAATNLQVVKDLLDIAQKLRNDISRSIRGGNSCDAFLYSPALDPYRIYANFHAFASQLCESHSARKE